MKFLVDIPLSKRVAEGLRTFGHEARHVADLGMRDAEDAEIATHAASSGAVVVTADSDFGMLASLSTSVYPSIILLRGRVPCDPVLQVKLLVANLPQFSDDLEAGAIVIIEPGRIRVRRLPLQGA